MLNLNLEKTKAGRELISMGAEEGERKGRLLKAREILIDVVTEKFGGIPESVVSKIKKISKEPLLNDLVKKALHCRSLDEFTKDMMQAEQH